jgi:hypothetical protein
MYKLPRIYAHGLFMGFIFAYRVVKTVVKMVKKWERVHLKLGKSET